MMPHTWWSDLPSHVSPYIFEVGSFRVGWYGLMYVVAFAAVYLISLYRIRREGEPYSAEVLEDYIFWVAVGLVMGGRLGYVLIYNPGYYIDHPLEVFLPFEFRPAGVVYTGIAGMSYHGGLIGAIAASVLCLRRHGVGFWEFADFIVTAVPFGYMFGRIGNFINGELYGRATDVAWGMYFPSDSQGLLRHPSQLYEAAFEGLGLFAVLWSLRRLRLFSGFHLAVYLIGYGAVRFVIEFFRQPDAQIGFVLGAFSMGQVLCMVMIAAGLCVAYVRRANKPRLTIEKK